MGLPVDSTLDFLEPLSGTPTAPSAGAKLWVFTDGTLHLRSVAVDKTVATTDQRAPALWLDTGAPPIQTPLTTDAGLTGHTLITGDFVIRTSDGEVFKFTSPSTFADQSYSVHGTGAAFSAHSSGVAMGTGGEAKLAISTVDFDTAGWWDATNTRYTPKLPGYYQCTVSFSGALAIASGNIVDVVIAKTGAPGVTARFESSISGSGALATATSLVQCNGSTDYIEMWGSSSVAGQTGTCTLQVAKVA